MSEQNQEEKAKDSNLSTEIWAVLFSALGIFILVSIISHFISGSQSNVLGNPGRFLAIGLIKVLGPFPALLLTASIGYYGYKLFRLQRILLTSMLLFIAVIIELCILFDVYNIYDLPASSIDPFNSIIGFVGISLLGKIFGPNPVGPYFVLLVALLLTIMIGLRINLTTIVGFLARAWRYLLAHIRTNIEKNRADAGEAVAQKKQEKIKKDQSKKEDAGSAVTTVAVIAAPVNSDPSTTASAPNSDIESREDDGESLARKQLEEELIAFRAKKTEPINILTPETISDSPDSIDSAGDEQAIDIPDESRAAQLSIERILSQDEERYKVPAAVPLKIVHTNKPYQLPDVEILADPPQVSNLVDRDNIQQNSAILERTLLNFGVEGKVVNVSPGPVVTRYEIELAPGVKVSRVVNLHDDLSMAVSGQKIRIQAPIPGKAAIGIELPNKDRQVVYFKSILQSEAFIKSKAKLPVVVGKSISGIPFVMDIARMPHLLIAGQTGSGKSVAINCFICSLLMTRKPDEMRMIMIDPKKVELSYFEGIPHLLSPVVTESKEAVKALQWGVIEMERRYRLLAKVGARNIDSFNERIEGDKIKEGIISDEERAKLPFIVIVVDELADLMLTASRDVEGLIQRIAQLARAVGIHLIVATQRPSVDIITGPIKANLTSRISFRTIQSVDSRTILGHVGAEKLLGMGDMLCLRNGAPDIERFHGAYIAEEEVEKIVEAIRNQNYEVEKIRSFAEATGSDDSADSFMGDDGGNGGGRDELFEEAARVIVSIGQGSTSLLQRRMKIGYARAGRLMDELHAAGIVGQQEGSKVREVLVKPDELELLMNNFRNM